MRRTGRATGPGHLRWCGLRPRPRPRQVIADAVSKPKRRRVRRSMTNPDESIDYLNRLEGPIVEALAAMEAGRLPHAIKVGEAFLAAKNIVVKDGITRNAGRKDDNWSAWLSRICKRQKI